MFYCNCCNSTNQVAPLTSSSLHQKKIPVPTTTSRQANKPPKQTKVKATNVLKPPRTRNEIKSDTIVAASTNPNIGDIHGSEMDNASDSASLSTQLSQTDTKATEIRNRLLSSDEHTDPTVLY